jgi:hypothetical protein
MPSYKCKDCGCVFTVNEHGFSDSGGMIEYPVNMCPCCASENFSIQPS